MIDALIGFIQLTSRDNPINCQAWQLLWHPKTFIKKNHVSRLKHNKTFTNATVIIAIVKQ